MSGGYAISSVPVVAMMLIFPLSSPFVASVSVCFRFLAVILPRGQRRRRR